MTSDIVVTTVLRGRDESLTKTIKGAGDTAQKTSGHFSSLGKIAAGVFTGGALLEGAQKGIEFLKSSVDAAMQDEQAQAILGKQMKNTAGASKEQISATEEWIKKQAEATGVTRDQMIPAFTQLVTATGSVSKSHKLMSLALNVSAGTGKSLTSVTGALVKAQNGSVGGLSRLGVATKNADGSTKSFLQVQKEMAAHFKGDASTAADTAAGKMKRLGVTWEDMKVSLGEHLLPVLTSVASFLLTKVVPAVSQLASWLGQHLGPIIKSVAGIFSHSTGQMHGTASKDFGAIQDIVSSVVSIIKTIWKDFGSFFVTYLRGTLRNVLQLISGVLKIIQGIFKVFSSLLKGDWKGVWTGIKEILSGALTAILAILKQALNVLKLLWKVAWTVLKAILGQVWDGIKALVRLEISGLLALMKGIPAGIMKLGGLMVAAGKWLIRSLFSGIVSAAKAGAGFVMDLVGDIKSAINSALHLPLQVNFDKGPLHIHATVIPALAKGGIVSRPTLAMIAEAGPEAVVPLSKLGSFGGRGGDLGTVTLRLQSETGREVASKLLRFRQLENGNVALGIG